MASEGCERFSSDKHIAAAADVAFEFGGVDGARHKTWCIDQMLRCLLTCNEYDQFKRAAALAMGDEWDEGIAP